MGHDTSSRKLIQEPHVIREEIADIVNAILAHRHPVRAHAEGKAAEDGRIVVPVGQHARMDHAGSHDLEPAGLFADAASLAAADGAAHVYFDAWLGEGEVALAEA